MTSLATLSMAALAERSGVDADTIKKYQRLGLVSWPRRTGHGLMLYSPDEVAHVIFVKQALALDFPVLTIRDMLGRARGKLSTCGDIHAIAEQHLADLRREIARLKRIEASLAPLVETCSRQGPRERCPVFATLSHQARPRTEVTDGDAPWSAMVQRYRTRLTDTASQDRRLQIDFNPCHSRRMEHRKR
jgi:MerR family mercuric resistance operon transcriptional regulator